MNRLIKCTQKDSIAFIVINLPLLTADTYQEYLNELFWEIKRLKDQPHIQSVILAGSGTQPASFTLEDIPENIREKTRFISSRCINQLAAARPLTIAAVNGPVSRNICETVLACRKRIGTRNTTFPAAVVTAGRIPEGELSAEQALELGILQVVKDPKDLISYCLEIAGQTQIPVLHLL